MKDKKVISLLFVLGIFFSLSSAGILAQDTVPSAQILPIKADQASPRLVYEIRFVGMRSVTSDELLEDFHRCLGDRPQVFDQRLYDYCAQKNSRGLMFSRGFFKATIRPVSARLVDDKHIVTIDVDEGIRYRLGEVNVNGAVVFSEKQILKMLGPRSGEVADGRELQDFIYDRLKREYEEKGYVHYIADFEPTFTEPSAEGLDGKVDVLITIDEGRKFSVGRIVFTGVENSVARLLKKEFLLKNGGVFIRSKFEASVENINKMNLFDHVDKDSDVELRTDEESDKIDLVIKLKKIQ